MDCFSVRRDFSSFQQSVACKEKQTESGRIWSISSLTDSPTSDSDSVRAPDKVDMTWRNYGPFSTLLTRPSVQQLSVCESEESFQSENIWSTPACTEEDEGTEEEESLSRGNLPSDKVNNTCTGARGHFISKGVTTPTQCMISVLFFCLHINGHH